ncbi:MAG: hypothetical protein M3P30_02810 [Chloroflexota bacterium]|nr:hypothetical protein [Chloroflexota bacterium]
MTSRTPAASAKTVTVAGGGAAADAWVRALRGIDGTTVGRLVGGTEDELLEDLSRGDVDAIAFVTPVPDLPRAIKRAVMAGRDVLVTTPAALVSKQLNALAELAERRGRVILFDTGSLGDERLTFVRKMTTGPQALWRTRYIRSLRTGVHGACTLDELAMVDIATVLTIAGGLPSLIAGVAPRVDDESGVADVAMVTLSFDGGPVARVDVSLVEPVLRQEIVIACDGRSVVLDALDARAPLQIQANARHRGPHADGQWSETISEHPVGEATDRLARAAAMFMTAVCERDIGATNAGELASAAQVWQTARASISRGGEPLSLADAGQPAGVRRPVLQLIHGGGHRSDAPLPELTLVVSR